MSRSVEKDTKRLVLSVDWFWPSIAAMVIAMMAFGYSCDGCGECRAPAPKDTPTEGVPCPVQ